MPIVGIPLDQFDARFGETLDRALLENELHRFGCSVEGWTTMRRFRCKCCAALAEVGEDESPVACEICGADFRSEAHAPTPAGEVKVLRMELLAVRPDLFDPAGLARAMRGFLGKESGAPRYRLETGEWRIEVDPALAGPDVHRPRIVAATLHDLAFDDGSLRSLMKLQETIHWALGRDRKLASIGVYDLAKVRGPLLRYAAAERDGLRFVPLGYDLDDPSAEQTPAEILDSHPKGKAFAKLLEGCSRVPLLSDQAGAVLSMPPIINSEATRVTLETRDVLIDVTGLDDRHIDRALNIVICSLLETTPSAHARTVDIAYGEETRRVPDLEAQIVDIDPVAAARLIGAPLSADEIVSYLGAMRHDAQVRGESIRVEVPAWRADILHPRDLCEDIAIAYGYDRLEEVGLTSATYGAADSREERAGRVRQALIGQGFLEVMTLALCSEEASFDKTGLERRDDFIRLEHPISVEQTMVRVSTIPGLMDTLAINLGHPYPQRICEVGLVGRLRPEEETGAGEELMAGFALAGDGFGYAEIRSAVDALLAEWPLLDPATLDFVPSDLPLFLEGRGAEVLAAGRRIGRLGEVSPAILENYRIIHPVSVAEFSVDALARITAAGH